MFLPVIDVIAVKHLEDALNRKLTNEEIEFVRYGEPITLTFPSGEIREIKIEALSIEDLMPSNVNFAQCERDGELFEERKRRALENQLSKVKRKKLSKAEVEHNKTVNKLLAGANDVIPLDQHGEISRQIFQKCESIIEYFEKIQNLVHTFKFKRQVDEYILDRHIDGLSDREISNMLRTLNLGLKELGHVQVGNIRKRILKEMGVALIEFNK